MYSYKSNKSLDTYIWKKYQALSSADHAAAYLRCPLCHSFRARQAPLKSP